MLPLDGLFDDTDRIFDRRSAAAKRLPPDGRPPSPIAALPVVGPTLQARICTLQHTDSEMFAYIRELEYREKVSARAIEPDDPPQVTVDDLNLVYQDIQTVNDELSARIAKLEVAIAALTKPSPKKIMRPVISKTVLPKFTAVAVKMTAEDLLG